MSIDPNAIADQLDGCRCSQAQDALDDAGETLADLRTALLNAETERDAAQAEVARLQPGFRHGAEVRRTIARRLRSLRLSEPSKSSEQQ